MEVQQQIDENITANSVTKHKSYRLELPSIHKHLPKTRTRLDISTNTSRLSSAVVIPMHTKILQELASSHSRAYSEMTQKQLEEQHNQLRQMLKNLNIQVAKWIDEAKFKGVKTPRPPPRYQDSVEIIQRELNNSQLILGNHQQQYLQLSRRVERISDKHPYDIDKEIRQLREKVEKLSRQNKAGKKEITLHGLNIVAESDLVKEIKILESDRNLAELKIVKLQNEARRVSSEVQAAKSKNSQLTDKYLEAEAFLKKWQEKEEAEQQLRRLAETFQQKQTYLEQLQKKKQTEKEQNNPGGGQQQKYLLKLKELENIISNSTKLDEKINVQENKLKEYRRMAASLETEFNKIATMINSSTPRQPNPESAKASQAIPGPATKRESQKSNSKNRKPNSVQIGVGG